MAEIVLGIGTSHGPMLVTEVAQWGQRIAADRASCHPWRERQWSFDQLVKVRSGEQLGEQSAPEEQETRRQRCHDAIDRLADIFSEARVDVALIVGNDQMELFDDRFIPAFSLFCGPTITNHDLTPDRLASLPPGIEVSIPGYIPQGGADYPGEPRLGMQLGQMLTLKGFDVAMMRELPKPETPHAFGFVYRHVMRDKPVPSVPFLINTFYPPNQPSAGRCIAIGSALFDAINAWQSDARVALIASGGLTHFVIDEELDRQLLMAIETAAISEFGDHSEQVFQSGTSEIKNWLPVARAMECARLAPEIIDYVPCYRSEAGTGNAMGFVAWRNR